MAGVPLDGSHLEAAVSLWEACGLTRPWNDPRADFLRAVRGPASTVLGVRSDGCLVATAMVGHDGHRGWVYYLAVDPSLQGSGLGRSLLADCEDWLRTRDIPKLHLMVRTGNDRVLGFYAALGYEQSDVVTMGKRLD